MSSTHTPLSSFRSWRSRTSGAAQAIGAIVPEDCRKRRHNEALAGCTASLRRLVQRTTLSYMKNASVTIRLDPKLQRELNRLSRQLGRSRSDLVRDALRRQLALVRFEQARRGLLPLAEAKGILSDEDVFDLVS